MITDRPHRMPRQPNTYPTCARTTGHGDCTPTDDRRLFITDDSDTVCANHVPARFHVSNCSHSLAPSGRCAYCRQQVTA